MLRITAIDRIMVQSINGSSLAGGKQQADGRTAVSMDLFGAQDKEGERQERPDPVIPTHIFISTRWPKREEMRIYLSPYTPISLSSL